MRRLYAAICDLVELKADRLRRDIYRARPVDLGAIRDDPKPPGPPPWERPGFAADGVKGNAPGIMADDTEGPAAARTFLHHYTTPPTPPTAPPVPATEHAGQ